MRLSVTMLDQYLYWKSAEDMTLEDFLARLRGTEVTPAMEAGRAFHSVLETATFAELQSVERDGWTFDFDLEATLPVPDIRELKAERIIQTPAGPVTLVGKVDALHGYTVRDYKLTERFDAERYADSYQWRAYLSMFHATSFVYDVFTCRYGDDKRVSVNDYHQLTFYTYPGIASDVAREVAGLAEIVAKHWPERAAA
jgi:hypothetical protein